MEKTKQNNPLLSLFCVRVHYTMKLSAIHLYIEHKTSDTEDIKTPFLSAISTDIKMHKLYPWGEHFDD